MAKYFIIIIHAEVWTLERLVRLHGDGLGSARHAPKSRRIAWFEGSRKLMYVIPAVIMITLIELSTAKGTTQFIEEGASRRFHRPAPAEIRRLMCKAHTRGALCCATKLPRDI